MQTRSKVEKMALKNSGFKLRYEPEKIGVVVVDNFPVLGKFTALRFLEWVQDNPNGVISLPTGKTPEFFIKDVQRFLNNWDSAEIQKQREQNGLDISRRPDLSGLHFVQIDEFYPISPKQHNSFYHYVNKYYIDALGLDPDKAMLIDCTKIGLPAGKDLSTVWPDDYVDLTLRYRQPRDKQERLQKHVLENVDQWCVEYEHKIRELGGIGFFLGGIGPDGHIGFNISGSDLHSTTRLTPTNYETQAVAAIDMGGIEVSKKRLVITIGLATITYNPDCVTIIIAAGEAKAQIVADAIQQQQHIHYPATALHRLPNARFFITQGAAKLLRARKCKVLERSKKVTDGEIEEIIIDLAMKKNKRIERLTKIDFEGDQLASVLLRKVSKPVEHLTKRVKERLIQKIEAGRYIQKNKIFLHTEPHHDDIMLGYLPYIVRHIREHSNKHYFATLTGGFTAVTNLFMLNLLRNLRDYLKKGIFDKRFEHGYFLPDNIIARNRDVWLYLDGVAANSQYMLMIGQLRRFVRNLVDLYDIKDIESLRVKVANLIHYFKKQYPGKKDINVIQQLKGRCREWEADCVWGYLGWHSESV
ncbi:MAG: 6-phosphogluconolactonase, partial [bacterium]